MTENLYDIEAEECVIGTCLLSMHAVETVLAMLVPADFGSPNLGAILSAIAALYRIGAAIDAKTVADELRTQGTTWSTVASDLVSIQTNTPAISSASRYAEIVARFALRRRVAGEAAELANAVRDMTRDPGELLDAHRMALAEIDSPVLATDPGDIDLDDFIARPIEDRAPWIIPGLLRALWRVILTAPEGSGKSMVLRQILRSAGRVTASARITSL